MARTERKSVAEMLDLNEIAEQTKKAVAWWIDSSEDLAKKGLEFQERTTAWANDTPLEKLFERQRAMTESLIENSASLARRFWRLEKPHAAKHEESV